MASWGKWPQSRHVRGDGPGVIRKDWPSKSLPRPVLAIILTGGRETAEGQRRWTKVANLLQSALRSSPGEYWRERSCGNFDLGSFTVIRLAVLARILSLIVMLEMVRL